MAFGRSRRFVLLLILALATLAVGGGAVWLFTTRTEPRSVEGLCAELQQVSSLSQTIVTLDPTLLGPQVADLKRATRLAPSDIQGQLSVLSVFVEEIAEAVRAAPTEKQEALVAALADRQSRIDEVTAAGQAVEAWSIANCGVPLRTTTTTTQVTTRKR